MQDYLKAIHSLGGAERQVEPAQIAGRLQVRAPSVTGMLKRLAEAGWIAYEPGSVSITNRGFQILALIFQDFLNLLLQTVLLRAHFRAHGKQRTTQHTTVFFADFRLEAVTEFAVFAQAFQRRNSRREN